MRTAFIGVGNMATAVISANAGSNLSWSDIVLYDIISDKINPFVDMGAHRAASVSDAVSMADCVFLSVKPQDYFGVLDLVKQTSTYKEKLYISIGAGISVATLEEYLDCNKIVRALPNTPMLIGKGVSAVCKNDNISEEDFMFAVSLFKNAGSVLFIDEADMNKTIGVTSSSPAYVFEFIKAIVNGATAQGLSEDGLYDAVCDVVIGAATLLKTSGRSADEMIAMVASKGGTTERALRTLSENDFSKIVSMAMQACTDRADELGRIK